MVRKISDAFNISQKSLNEKKVFNGFIDMDSLFYVDPYLLKKSSIKELKYSYDTFRNYFENIIKLLETSSDPSDRIYKEAVRRLTFREIPFTALGYSKTGVAGSGIGITIAKRLARTASEIIEAGIKDPQIFELVGLFEEGIGADRISDMTVKIIIEDLLKFSERIAQDLDIHTHPVKYNDKKHNIPFDLETRRTRILMPKEILRSLPVALDWSDIDMVCSHNINLRQRVNKIIGKTWRYATRYVSKRHIKEIVLKYPEILRDLLDQYKDKEAKPYNFRKDPEGEIIWYDISKKYAENYPLYLHRKTFTDIEGIIETVRKICEKFGDLIENNGLWKHLYNDDGELRHERYAQLLFFGIADSYCEANELDLNREPNAGRGPVDFKISSGYKLRVLVEVKYSSNTQLVRGYEKQLPTYIKSEKSFYNFYLVIRTTEATSSLESIEEIRREEIAKGNIAPEIIVVDGRKQVSASKL